MSFSRFLTELKSIAALANSGRRLRENSDPMTTIFSALAVQSLRIRAAWFIPCFGVTILRRVVTVLLC